MDTFDKYRQSYPHGKESDHTWGGRLEKIASTIPDRIAFIRGEKELTWRQFNQRVNRLANALLDLGIHKEQRVAIMGFNSIEWMESYFAASKIGAVPVNVNPRFIAAELKHILDDSQSSALIMESDNMDRILQIKGELPELKHYIVMDKKPEGEMFYYEDLMQKYPETRPSFPWRVTNDDFAFLFYTGGTTGYPKGTVWDYYNRVRGLDAIMVTAMEPLIQRLPYLPSEAYAGIKVILPVALSERFFKGRLFKWLLKRAEESESGDELFLRLLGSKINYRIGGGKMRMIAVAPLFHGTAYESNFSMIGASAGTSIYLKKRHPFDPAELWQTLERTKANIIVIVGDAFAVPMVEELERKDYDISSLAAIISSGVRFSPGVKKRFLKKHPGLLLLDELGSTETSAAYTQVSASDDEDISMLKIKISSKGINQTRVINPLTNEDVKPGEKGELVFGGFNALGYWNDPEKTDKHFRPLEGRSWFHVGDEGTMDHEGYFHLIGRGSSIINTGGEKVYAEEVEEILLAHPHIRDAGVTGVPDERWGEAVTAVIETTKDADLTPEEIIQYCRERMAGYKKPKNVFFVEKMPRSASGKLERKELKESAKKMMGE